MRIVSFFEARNTLKQVADRVVEDADLTVITRRDAPHAAVMSLGTLTSWMETVHLRKAPGNAAHLAKSIGQLRADTLRTPPDRCLRLPVRDGGRLERLPVLAAPGPQDADARQRADPGRAATSIRGDRHAGAPA